MLSISYWITEATSADFLIYIGSDSEVVFDLLPTMPTAYMLLEFPFNMIPIDWPMLVFVQLLFSLYILINFVAVACSSTQENVYDAFNWYNRPGVSFGSLIASYCILVAVFSIFLIITHKWKLPKYKLRHERRYTTMSERFASVSAPNNDDSQLDLNNESRIS